MPFCADTVERLVADAPLERFDMHAYQDGKHGAVEFLKLNPFSAIFIDLGLGKTVTSLTLVLDLVREFEIGCVLVIGPLRVVKETWPTEINEWRHTAGMTYSFIRDEVLSNAVNAGGAAGREHLKQGMAHPQVFEILMRVRKHDITKAVHKMRLTHGLTDLKQRRQLIAKKLLAAETIEPSTKEKKLYVEQCRRLAAREAVRKHKRDNPATIYAINREQVAFLVDAWGADWPYGTVIIDESSSLKDHSTKRFKALAKARQYMIRMHQLTATPAAETYLHLYAQLYLLDLGKRLGKSITAYQDEFFKHNRYTHTYSLLPGAADAIATAISDICLTMKAEDYLSRDKPTLLTRHVTLSDKEMAIYKTMENDSVVTLQGREIEAENAAALSTKLLQLASGVLYETYLTEDWDTDDLIKVKRIHEVHTRKIESMQDLVDETNGEPLLVAYHFKSSLARLQKAFPQAVVMDREGNCIKPWNQGKIPMLLMHPQSGGHGLNLQKGGRHVVFYDIPWSLELYLQFIGRLDRQGQQMVVFIHHLVARGTLDELVVDALMNKKDMQDTLFRLLKRLRKNAPRRLTVDVDDDEL